MKTKPGRCGKTTWSLQRPLTIALAAGTVLLAQSPAPAPTPAPTPGPTPGPTLAPGSNRVGELERLGEGGRDLMILGVDAPGFDKLKVTQRKYAYFLYRAAIAGNDIAYFQNHRSAYEIKELLEQIYLHREGIDSATVEGLEEYLKMVWANHGQYGHNSHLKFVPRLSRHLKIVNRDGISPSINQARLQFAEPDEHSGSASFEIGRAHV